MDAGYTGTEAEFYAALVSLQNAPFLPLSGGTMTGALTLSGAPTAELHAATMGYVDSTVSSAIGAAIAASY